MLRKHKLKKGDIVWLFVSSPKGLVKRVCCSHFFKISKFPL
jgi:hypothetical protein